MGKVNALVALGGGPSPVINASLLGVAEACFEQAGIGGVYAARHGIEGVLQEELVDRFGELPQQALSLVETHRLRLAGRPLGIVKLDAGEKSLLVQFCPNPPIDPANIILLIQSDRTFKLAGPDRLSWARNTATLKERVGAVKELFRRLGPPR